MERIKTLFKHLLGFHSPYSWVKWLRISFAVIALIIALAFWSNFSSLVLEGGIVGLILSLILLVVLFGPILLAMLGIATLIGLVIGGTTSGLKQRKSIRETAATGSAALMEVEKLRVKSQLLDFAFLLTALALVALVFFLVEPLYDSFGEYGLYGYLFSAAVLLIAFWLAKLPAKLRYRSAFKEAVVKEGLESLLENMDFQPDQRLDEAVVRASALFPEYDDSSGNDFLSADYHDHHFIQSDLHLQKEKEETYFDKEGNLQTKTVYVTVFRGRMTVFDYDAVSNEPVSVYDRGGTRPKSGEEVQTELDAFNRQFFISAGSPEAALRILTPPVLEGIVLARQKLGCPLFLSFRDDKLYVAFANGDAFEAAGGDATLSEQRGRVTEEISAMLALIDTLYLKQEGGVRS